MQMRLYIKSKTFMNSSYYTVFYVILKILHYIVQMPTVDEHFTLIIENDDTIDHESGDVTLNDLPNWYDTNLYKQ